MVREAASSARKLNSAVGKPLEYWHPFSLRKSNYLPNEFYGAEHNLRSHQLRCYWRTSQNFMKTEDSLPHSQKLSTCPYPEPEQSSQNSSILSSQDPYYIIIFLVVSFPMAFPPNNLYSFLFSLIRAAYPAHMILVDLIILIILGEECKLQSSSLFSFHHPPSLRLSLVQIFSSASYSQPPWVCVPPLMLQTKFRTHKKPKAKL
jgi:hypothetical protein